MTLSLGFSVDVVSSLRSRTEDPLFFIVIKVLTAFPFINNLYKKPGSLHSSLLSFIPLISSSISWQLPFEKEKKKEKSRKGRQIYHSPTEQCGRKSAEELRAQMVTWPSLPPCSHVFAVAFLSTSVERLATYC